MWNFLALIKLFFILLIFKIFLENQILMYFDYWAWASYLPILEAKNVIV